METSEPLFDCAAISETTRIEAEQIRRMAEQGDDETREILLSLYQKQKHRARELSQRLNQSNDQALKYAVDLTNVHRRVKEREHELAEANTQLRRYAVDLRATISRLKATHKELEDAYFDTIRRLVIAAEYKDRDTGNHIARISRYSALLAEKIGMTPADVQTILYASPMHDIGKIGIPDRILLKTEKLLAPEFELMKMHTLIGSNILADSKAKVLQWAQQIALFHHEKWNGEGYPQGTAGSEIPLHARIVALADTFDALTSKRPYKEAFPIDTSRDIIISERGKHFDPEITDAFLACFDEIRRIHEQYSAHNPSHSLHMISGVTQSGDIERLAQLYR